MATRRGSRATSQARRRRTTRPIGIHCVPSHYALLPRKHVRLRAVLSRPTRATLTYTWTTNAGQLVSRGSRARFDSTGMPGGIGATVRVRVRSAGGRRGQAQCRIDILPRVPAPGVFTCVAGGFSLRSYALRDIDTACIDDVCTRLHWSPRERLLIVGHADRNESNPHHIGLKRAGAAAIYAVHSCDLPRARIRVASAGAARPLDEGQGSAARARNRRLELTIFALPVPA